MAHKFLTDQQLKGLPKEPRLAFSAVVSMVGSFLDQNILPTTTSEADNLLRQHAVRFIKSVAEQLAIPLEGMPGESNTLSLLRAIEIRAASFEYAGFAERIGHHVGVTSANTPGMLTISNFSAVRLYELSIKLRLEITEAKIDEKKRQKLLGKLNEFEAVIEDRHLSIPKALGIVALIAAGIAGTTSTLADAPAAINTVGLIAGILGEELGSDEELKQISAEKELLRLPPPDDDGDSSKN